MGNETVAMDCKEASLYILCPTLCQQGSDTANISWEPFDSVAHAKAPSNQGVGESRTAIC